MTQETYNSHIDTSMFPSEAKRITSPLQNMLLAIFITLSLLTIMGIGAFFTRNMNGTNRENSMALIGGVALLSFTAIITRLLVKLSHKLRWQRVVMQKFAHANGWSYKDERSMISDKDMPSGYDSVYPNTIRRFVVEGTLPNGEQFSFYQLYGSPRSSSGWYIFSGPYRDTYVHIGVLRLNHILKLSDRQISNDISLRSANGFGYIIYAGNILNRGVLQQVFALALEN